MSKYGFKFFIAVLLFLSFLSVTYAETNQMLPQEQIVSFVSSIKVNADNSIDVTETITYNTGPQERHGIYRDIYPYASTGKKMDISVTSVTNENSIPYMFTLPSSGSDFRIKIGDPDRTFSGEKIYVIKYHATNAVAQFKDFDEIYWNATGNGWNIPIDKASASVVLPSGATMTQSSCYFGPNGSNEQCMLTTTESPYNFNAPRSLGSGEGMTVAVGFAKGFVAPYSASDSIIGFFEEYKHWFIAAILPLLTLIFSLLYWYRKGRDPKGTGVIVPQYEVIDGLTPLEIAGIVNQKVTAKDISSEIIYLATKGYLKITQVEEKHILGLFTTTDYELTKLKDPADLPNEFDRTLLWGLFGRSIVDPESKTTRLSSLKNKFYTHIKPISKSVMKGLLDKGYYKNLAQIKFSTSMFILIPSYVAIKVFIRSDLFVQYIWIIVPSIVLSVIIYHVVSQFFPAKTEKGIAAKEYILGLKDYLQIAEKDRLIFHNAPEKKPEIFEKLLPYAMALGVAGIWAKEFEGIYTTPPTWYVGPTGSSFNSVSFNNSVAHFGSFASSSMTSSPSGSGSGGGGFSGGGGGGGGGGGW